ncbi:MAG: ammonia channel protein, partial [Burkholderiales bacterium]
MKKLIIMISLGLAVLGFSGASLAQDAASAPAATATESGIAAAAATPAADAASAPAATVDKGDV